MYVNDHRLNFLRRLRWSVHRKRRSCENQLASGLKQIVRQEYRGAALCAWVQGMQYPCAGQGQQPCPVSGVSPLSTGYYLRINEAGLQQSCFGFLDDTQKEMEEKPLRLTRHNGRSGKNGAYNPKHNDRRFDLENSEHIECGASQKKYLLGLLSWNHNFR